MCGIFILVFAYFLLTHFRFRAVHNDLDEWTGFGGRDQMSLTECIVAEWLQLDVDQID